MNRERAYRLLLQLAVVAVVTIAISCSPTNKIIRSGDPWLIYDHAVMLYEREEWKKAGDLFEAMQPYYVGGTREDTLQFYQARCKFKSNDYNGAMTQLDDFRRRFGRSTFIEDAEGMYALSYYYLSPPVSRDQTLTKQAIAAIDEFRAHYPESEQLEVFDEIRGELIGRLQEKSFLNAYIYYKIGRYKSSIVAFRNAQKEYPDGEWREEISYYIVLSAYELAANSVLSKKEDRFLDMLDSYYTFIAEFPESIHRQSVDKMERKAREYIAKQSEIKAKGGVTDENIKEVGGKRAEKKRERAEKRYVKEQKKAAAKAAEAEVTEEK